MIKATEISERKNSLRRVYDKEGNKKKMRKMTIERGNYDKLRDYYKEQ